MDTDYVGKHRRPDHIPAPAYIHYPAMLAELIRDGRMGRHAHDDDLLEAATANILASMSLLRAASEGML